MSNIRGLYVRIHSHCRNSLNQFSWPNKWCHKDWCISLLRCIVGFWWNFKSSQMNVSLSLLQPQASSFRIFRLFSKYPLWGWEGCWKSVIFRVRLTFDRYSTALSDLSNYYFIFNGSIQLIPPSCWVSLSGIDSPVMCQHHCLCIFL